MMTQREEKNLRFFIQYDDNVVLINLRHIVTGSFSLCLGVWLCSISKKSCIAPLFLPPPSILVFS
jgi:hypothetical protein